jgi:hypothetical protein
MSLYDTVRAEYNDAPPYAQRDAFTSYFGYAGGVSLGSFPTIADATSAGAKSTEKVFDAAGFKAAQDALADYNKMVNADYMTRLRVQHPEVNDAVFDLAYAYAWDRSHSYGNNEVEIILDDVIDLAVKVIAAAKD